MYKSYIENNFLTINIKRGDWGNYKKNKSKYLVSVIKYLLERLGVDIHKIDIKIHIFKDEKNNFSGIIYIKWDISENKEGPFIEIKINEPFLTKVLEHLCNKSEGLVKGKFNCDSKEYFDLNKYYNLAEYEYEYKYKYEYEYDYLTDLGLGLLPNDEWDSEYLRYDLESAILEALAKHEASHILSLPFSKIPEEVLSDKILLDLIQTNDEYFLNDYRNKIKVNYILVRFIRIFKEVIAERFNILNFGIDPHYLLYLEELIEICIKDLKKMHIIFVDPLKEILFLMLQDLSYIFMADDLVQNQIEKIKNYKGTILEKLNGLKRIIERIKTKIKLLLSLSLKTSLRSNSYRNEMLYSRIIEVFRSFTKIIEKFESKDWNRARFLEGYYEQPQEHSNKGDNKALNNLKKMYIQVFKVAMANSDLFL